ncbi:MAG: septal ring lytic transglycosylase RlpA family protein [Gammaproteobacteria bacterium]|nr:septal ring lytic transglycosylase RlpA family protein [Gammaproteobacteria bacterium]
MIHRAILLLLISVSLSACGPLPERPDIDIRRTGRAPGQCGGPKSESGNPPHYEVFGQRYYVMNNSDGYSERGVASWYGKKFHGRRTSNGEIYNMHDMTAAHKTLPLPNCVRVTNLNNGKSVILHVNDRGPFKDNRIIDVSYAAARRLDMVTAGTAFVEVSVINPGGRDTRRPAVENRPVSGAVFIQVGAFGENANARKFAGRLRQAGLPYIDVVNEKGLYKVRLGPLASVEIADTLSRRLKKLGIDSFHLVFD